LVTHATQVIVSSVGAQTAYESTFEALLLCKPEANLKSGLLNLQLDRGRVFNKRLVGRHHVFYTIAISAHLPHYIGPFRRRKRDSAPVQHRDFGALQLSKLALLENSKYAGILC
jgi:hypothetical protein